MLRIPVSGGLVLCFLLIQAPAVLGQPLAPERAPAGLSAFDWSSIWSAIENGKYAVQPEGQGYRVRNPGQRWQSWFDGSGFITRPDRGSWSWGLQLESYGFAGGQQRVIRPTEIRAEGQRVAYDWDDTLTEWYQNDSRGLEHGYTVKRRPSRGEQQGPLTLALAVRGGLIPRVQGNRRGVSFEDGEGLGLVTYSGLTVFDAAGRSLPAWIEWRPAGLLVIIDERDARYPLTVDPLAQQAYLKASNSDVADEFGRSVAVSGDTVVVGAIGEGSDATGVNGDQANENASSSGAAYVFVRNGTGWSQQAYLKPSNTDPTDLFGISVAISGDTVVVGSEEGSSASGVNGDENDNSAAGAGAAYVFVRSGTTWAQQAYLKASNPDAFDLFGRSVAVSGDTVVVGAFQEDSHATGVDGVQSDNSADFAGAAYVFTRSGTTWSQQAYLKASNTETGDRFGISVGVSGDTVVVGAREEDSDADDVNGNQGDNNALGAGAAYIFVRNGTTWSQQAYLKASNSDVSDQFGFCASISGDTAVVGAFHEDSSSVGVNGTQGDNSAFMAGAAYVFARNGTSWSQQAYLKASNTEAFDSFGISVAIWDDTVVVGAMGESSNSTGVNGNQGDNSVSNSGAAYKFVRTGTSWSQQAYLKASNPDTFDCFGYPVAAFDNTLVVGAFAESSAATGVNGDGSDNSANHAGAAYVFDDADPNPWSDQGCALAGVLGDPLLLGSGTLAAGSSNSVDLSNAAPSALAGLFIALSSNPVAFKGGTLKPFPFLELFILTTDGTGAVSIPFSIAPGVPAGVELWLQWAIRDASAIAGVSLSNAVRGVTP